jgi:hypothetical protein
MKSGASGHSLLERTAIYQGGGEPENRGLAGEAHWEETWAGDELPPAWGPRPCGFEKIPGQTIPLVLR